MMTTYNQPYSEIRNMSISDLIFYVELAHAENQYIKQKRKQTKGKGF